jgi:hypothetical protein
MPTGVLRRRQKLRRAVLAAGGRRGARVGRQQQRARAVGGWGSNAWQRGAQEMTGGGQERRITPAAGRTRGQSREQRRQEEERGRNVAED